jgi:hypothetical protein
MGTPLYKRIVVLAKSVKHKHWCVAGKEVFESHGRWMAGLWVRPTDPANEGAITREMMRCDNGHIPQPFDIVDVPVAKCATDPHHPEDWIVDASRPWKHCGIFPASEADALVDTPPQLWGSRTDPRKLAEGYVAKMLRPASLYFIKPAGDFRIALFKEEARPRKRVALRYHDIEHEFDITDPSFEDHYLHGLRLGPEQRFEFTLKQDGRLYLCLSLTPPFHGAHYKIAATIWEKPPA